MKPQYLIFGGLALGAVALVMMGGLGGNKPTTTADIPTTTSGTVVNSSTGFGQWADISQLGGVDYVMPNGMTLAQIIANFQATQADPNAGTTTAQ